MHQYRRLSPVDAASESMAPNISRVVEPAPATRERLRPTRFNIGRSDLDETTPLPQETTVEKEYQKYIGGLSSAGTDILRFWEVRSFWLNDAMT